MLTFRMRFNCFIVIILWAFQVPMTAQTFSEEELDSIAYSLDLDNVVITAQYEPTHYKNALQQIQTISKKTIEQRGFTQLDQALAQLPSIRFQRDPILGPSILMRGVSSDNVAVLVDGVPIIGRLDGALDLSQVSLANIERIEVIEGPQSNLYGNNAAGGVINLITRKSQLKKWRANATSQFESVGIQAYNLQVGSQLGKLYLSATGRYLEDQQYPTDSLRVFEEIILSSGQEIRRKKFPWNPKVQKNAGALARYQFSEGNELLVKYDWADEVVSNLGEVRRPAFMPYAFDNYFTTKRSDISANFKSKPSPFLYMDLSLAYNDYTRLTDNERFEFDLDARNEDLSSIDTSNFDAYFAKATLASFYDSKFNFLTGFQLNHETGDGERVLDVTQEDSLKVRATEYAFFADVKYKPSQRLESSLSGRFINHTAFGFYFTPAVQTKYLLGENLTFRGGYAKGFRSPALKELYINFIDVNHDIQGNIDLLPEKSDDINASLDYSTLWNEANVNLNAKAYWNKIQDKIILAESEPGKFTYQNISENQVYGMGVGVSIAKGVINFSSNVGIGFWDNQLEDSSVTSPDPTPTFDASNNLGIAFHQGLGNFSLNHRYIGKTPQFFVEAASLVENVLDDYHLLDASVSYKVWKNRINLTAGAKNLLNISDININGMHTQVSDTQLVDRGTSYFVTVNVGLEW